MRPIQFDSLVRAIPIAVACSANSCGSPLPVTGPYLGQKPPGLKPQLFAHGLISNDPNGGPLFPLEAPVCFWDEMDGSYIMRSGDVEEGSGRFLLQQVGDVQQEVLRGTGVNEKRVL